MASRGKQTKTIPSSIRAREERKKFLETVSLSSLTPLAKRVIKIAPDVAQRFLCDPSKEVRIVNEFKDGDRYYDDIKKAPRLAYRRRKGEAKTVRHIGQEKLFLSEVEFLATFSKPGDICVYAGAAPGTHQGKLAELFPKIHFILYDPRDFHVKETEMRTIRKHYFTNMTANYIAQKFRGKRLLFLSDIRRDLGLNLTDRQKENIVKEDMESQKIWVRIMRPTVSLLKFRLPYPEGKKKDESEEDYEKRNITKYLDGRIYIQPYAPSTSTETRLVVTDPDSERLYNNIEYEQMMFYHNTEKRTTVYMGVENKGYTEKDKVECRCYDCAAKYYIMKKAKDSS